MKKEINGVILDIVQGDIASQKDIDAVVNAANARLMPGGGVAGAIHRAAGSGLAEECEPLANIEPGDAVITGAHNLPNSHVIHCLGPVYGMDKPEEKLLRSCYKKALQLAEENNIESVAFPAISTGAFGYPLKEATEIAIDTVLAEIPGLKKLKLIRFVLFGKKDLKLYEEIINERM